MVCTLWLTAVYNDAITYALYYLSVFYTNPRMMTWISLSTVPSNIIFFPIIVFMLEYHDFKKNKAKSDTGTVDTSTYKIVLSIILRVVKNPLVWAGVSGIILNQAVLGPKGKFPVWFSEIFLLSRACTMPINMFLLGVFTSTYGPIHTNIMRFLCCLVSPIKRLCGSSSNEEASVTPDNYQPASSGKQGPGEGSSLHSAGGEGEEEVPKPPVWGEQLNKAAEEGKNKHTLGMWEKKPLDADEVDEEMEVELEEDDEQEKERQVQREPPQIVTAPISVTVRPAEAPTAGAPPPAAAGAKSSDDYKFNFWLLLTELFIRHIISPLVMLVLCLIFAPLLTAIQRHCMVVMTAFGTGGPVFVLGRQYNAYPGEAAVTQVAGAFILNVVFFVVFYYICQAIWPL